MIKSQQHIFQPGAMSIIQMGEELIGHPSTAINELVKNGYDADADKCWVYTHYDKDPNKTFIIIKDNGLGMKNEVLFGDWLRPSVSSKRDEDREKRKSKIYERRYLGSKGIGRLAAMALGRHLTVISKTNQCDNYNWLIIDREKFRVESLLENINFPGGEIEGYTSIFSDSEFLLKNELSENNELTSLFEKNPFNEFNEGTTIIIQGLDESIRSIIESEFQTKELEETAVFKSLRDLITPLKLNSKIQKDLVELNIIDSELKVDNGESTFDLYYGINFVSDYQQIEPSKIINEFDYRVFGKVTSKGDVLGKYICNRFEHDVREEGFILDSNTTLATEEEKLRTIFDIDELNKPEENSNVGEFYFDFRIYDLDTDSKTDMVKFLNASGRREANRMFSSYLGIKVSKNGFAVKPYGDEDRDWLGLGAKRVQQHIISIGPNQIIGNTFLYSPQNDGLSEKTNREGFFENKAFINFKRILGGILSETGKRRAKYRAHHNLGRQTKSKHNRPDMEKFVQYILIKSNRNKEIVKRTETFISEVNTALDNMEESLSFSQRLASLGAGLELVYHELAQPITALGASKKSIELNIKKISDSKLKFILLDRVNNIGISINMLNDLKESLQPAIGKSLPKIFNPFETFNKVCYLFENTLRDLQIELVVTKTVKEIEIKNLEYIFWIAFLNIINNAVYWLNLGDQKRVITFEYLSERKMFAISNTGPKIPEDDLEIIFNYGITGKKEKNATGLGLSFTKNMLSTIGWDIVAENMSYGPVFLIYPDNDM